MTNHLLREFAPVTDRAWELVDEEAKSRLTARLVARRLVDFALDVGQDLSIGYVAHDAETVTLYIEESFTFRVVEPDAGLALRG